MKEMKYIISGLLLVGIALSLSITVPTQLRTVAEGQVADFTVIVENNQPSQNVLVTIDSGIPVSVTESAFFLPAGETKTIKAFAVTNGLGDGLYLVNLKINGQDVNLAVNVGKGDHTLIFNAVYDEIRVTQGEYQDLKFILRNEGNERIRNIVINGDIPTSLSADYPTTLDLNANEVREIKVRVTIPRDYPSGNYYVSVLAGAGNLVVQDSVRIIVEGDVPLSEKLDVDVLLPWKAIKEEGTTVGYSVTFRVKNRGISDVNGIAWNLEGVPEGWDVSGIEDFSIAGYEEKDIEVKVIPTDFNEAEINIALAKGNEEIHNEKLVFAGYKIGKAPTGMFMFGGSAAIGIIIVIALALALLYMRSRNAEDDEKEEVQTRNYLEKLVQKARKEQEESRGKK